MLAGALPRRVGDICFPSKIVETRNIKRSTYWCVFRCYCVPGMPAGSLLFVAVSAASSNQAMGTCRGNMQVRNSFKTRHQNIFIYVAEQLDAQKL